MLALLDFDKEFVIESDASENGLGAILLQQGCPIAYYNKALVECNIVKSAYENEFMAAVLSIQHLCPYLLGRKFKVCTDLKSLRQLLLQRVTTMDQQNWATKLLGYQFEIVYKPEVENRGADAFSQMHDSTIVPNSAKTMAALQEGYRQN